jgi:hypothetical protein
MIDKKTPLIQTEKEGITKGRRLCYLKTSMP